MAPRPRNRTHSIKEVKIQAARVHDIDRQVGDALTYTRKNASDQIAEIDEALLNLKKNSPQATQEFLDEVKNRLLERKQMFQEVNAFLTGPEFNEVLAWNEFQKLEGQKVQSALRLALGALFSSPVLEVRDQLIAELKEEVMLLRGTYQLMDIADEVVAMKLIETGRERIAELEAMDLWEFQKNLQNISYIQEMIHL